MRSVEWTASAKKYFDALPGKIQEQLRKKIMALRPDPFTGSVALKDWHGVRRIRSGDWRVLFRVMGESIRIIAIGPRGDIYK